MQSTVCTNNLQNIYSKKERKEVTMLLPAKKPDQILEKVKEIDTLQANKLQICMQLCNNTLCQCFF